MSSTSIGIGVSTRNGMSCARLRLMSPNSPVAGCAMPKMNRSTITLVTTNTSSTRSVDVTTYSPAATSMRGKEEVDCTLVDNHWT
jgi:hypothetical protein